MRESTRATTSEGVALGFVLSNIYIPMMGMYLGTNEVFENLIIGIEQDVRWLVPAVIFLITGAIGWSVEAAALKKKGFSVNVVSTAVYGKTKKAALALPAGTLYGLASNPQNLFLLGNVALGQEASLATLAHLSTVFALGSVHTGVNGLIAAGKLDKAVLAIRWVKELSEEKAKNIQDKLISKIEV